MSATVIDVTDATFETEVIQSPLPVLVEFGAAWCGPCKLMLPILNLFASAKSGKVKVVKMDVDTCPETAKKLGIRSVPTLAVFTLGNLTVKKIGATTLAGLYAMVEPSF